MIFLRFSLLFFQKVATSNGCQLCKMSVVLSRQSVKLLLGYNYNFVQTAGLNILKENVNRF